MNRRMWSKRVLRRYALLQVPGGLFILVILFMLHRVTDLAPSLLLLILIIWVVKDIVLFPFVWKAYDSGDPSDFHSMIGMTGVATERLQGTGYITVRGELWQARPMEGDMIIQKGDLVQVCGIDGLMLYVKPLTYTQSEFEANQDSLNADN